MPNENDATSFTVGLAILTYSVCSSTLLLANKLAMSYIPKPGLVSVIQLVFATIAILMMKHQKLITVDELEMKKIKPYMFYVVAFVFSIFANMQALDHSNVETVIVFRACTPIATTVIDYLYMGREWPTNRSMAALLTVAAGAVFYCLSDSQLAMEGLGAYFWVTLYYLMIVFEMTYGKKLTENVQMESPWGSTLYCNILAILPMTILGACLGDISNDSVDSLLTLPAPGVGLLLFSCIVGVGIGYSGWNCRAITSATTYTLVGVVNKFLTILLNVLIWSNHSSGTGLVAVCGCLMGGAFYQQAPKRQDYVSKPLESLRVN